MASPAAPLTIHLNHSGTLHTLTLPRGATLNDLSASIGALLAIPPEAQKLLIKALPPQRHPFSATSTLLSVLALQHPSASPSAATPQTLSVRLLAAQPPASAALDALNAATQLKLARREASLASARQHLAARPRAPASGVRTLTSSSGGAHAFARILPLPHLPHPERSRAFLERLAADAGIVHAMAAHRFSVGLLTEMDPALHTTHHSRTLGLNRNRGEVIELRLRTDDGEGYRDYRGVRRTLCHELAHCVWGEHDGRFWKLCGEVERDVEGNDGVAGGRALTGEAYFDPEERMRGEEGERGEHVDGGGWVGKGFVLGAGEGPAQGAEDAGVPVSGETERDPMAEQRELRARAAERRSKGTGPS